MEQALSLSKLIEIGLRSTGKAVLAARVRKKDTQEALESSTHDPFAVRADLSLEEWFRNSEEAGISGLSLFSVIQCCNHHLR
jgi:hypothetical protein